MTTAETALLTWMIDFFRRCERLEEDLKTPDYSRIIEYKERYKALKAEIRAKDREVAKLKVGKQFRDEGFLNRCVSNIGESTAFGFREKSNSNNLNKLYISVEEGAYKIAKFMSEYSDQFGFY